MHVGGTAPGAGRGRLFFFSEEKNGLDTCKVYSKTKNTDGRGES